MKAAEFAKRRARIGAGTDYRRNGHKRRAFESLVRRARAIIIIVCGKIVGWRMTDGQVVCKKRRYSSAERSDFELAGIMRKPSTKQFPCRSYQCQYCEGWHHTHQPRENLS